MALPNPQHTYLAYHDSFWTSERGADKFISNMIRTLDDGYEGGGAILNGFQVVPTTPASMSVIVKSGAATDEDSHLFINYAEYGFFGWMSQDLTLDLVSSEQLYGRVSLIVAYVDFAVTPETSDEEIESPGVLKIVEVPGIPSANPAVPTASDIRAQIGAMNPYIVLAQIRVAANATQITSGNIIDNTKNLAAQLGDNISLNQDNTYCAGFVQADSNKTKTRIVITGPNVTPAPIPGVELVWLRKKI